MFSQTGCCVLVVLNLLLIPRYSYMGCAWAGFAGYGTAMLLSYFIGQKKYPIPYDLKAIFGYVLLAAALCGVAYAVEIDNLWLRLAFRSLLLLLFLGWVVRKERAILRR